jgi:hypothetical protein
VKLTIPLGVYGLEFADLVRSKFNAERNKNPERSPMRLNAHILFRGRGKRNTYVKRKNHPSKWVRNAKYNGVEGDQDQPMRVGGSQDLPVEYAQKVALYLIIDLNKTIKQYLWQFKREVGKQNPLTYIKETYTEQTGGGCMVDMIVRNDGKIIGVSDECVVVYKNIDAFWNQDKEIGSIYTYGGENANI